MFLAPRFVRLSLFAGCSLLFGPSAAPGEDWNQWRGPHRDGAVRTSPPLRGELPAGGLHPVWINHGVSELIQNAGWSSPVVAQGRVYVFAHRKTRRGSGELPPVEFPYLEPEARTGMTKEEYDEYEARRRDEQERRSTNFRFEEVLLCLDAADGQLLWRNVHESRYTRFFQSGTPAIIGGRAYVLGAGRVARAIDAATGEDIWSTALPGPFRDEPWHSSIAVADGIAAAVCSSFYGLDAATGRLVWEVPETDNPGSHTSPVVWEHAGVSYFIANVNGGETVAVEARSGRELWRVRSDAVHSTPVVAGDRLVTFGSSRKKGLRCFGMTAAGAELLWVYQESQDPGSSPVVVGSSVYVQGEHRLACVDLETGQARWTTMLTLDNPRYTSLVATPDAVIYAFDGVFMFAARGERFELLMDARLDKSGLLAEMSEFRRQLDLDALEKTLEGQKESQRLQREAFLNHGPLPCASPALAGGHLYLRLKKGIACYDLRLP